MKALLQTEKDPFVLDARRLAAAAAALAGIALVVVGAWFAIAVGPSGTVSYTAQANEPLVIGPMTLNRVSTPVTVTATSASGPVFVGAAFPQDTSDVVGTAKHQDVQSAVFSARALTLTTTGVGALADPAGLHVWRQTAQNTLVVEQQNAPEAVLVYPSSPGPVDVTVTWQRGVWFLESAVVLIVGLIIVAFAGGWLRQQLRSAGPASAAETS